MTKAHHKKWFLALSLLFGLIIIYFSREVITPFVLAFFLAYAINPLVEFLQQKGARRCHAVLTVYLVLTLLVGIIFWLIIPRLVRDLTEISTRLPVIFNDLEKWDIKLTKIYWRLPLNLQHLVAVLTSRGELMLKGLLTSLVQGLLNLLSQSLGLILVPLLAYYINLDYPRLKRELYQWSFTNLGAHWTRTFLKIDGVFRQYIRGQLLDTIIVGLLIGLGLSLLGFDAAFLFGIIAGMFNLIPYFGPIIGALPVLVLGLLRSPWVAGYVVLLFIVINQFEVMYLTPKIIGGNLKLHPVTVVYLVLLGGKVFGLLGMIFAVPIGAILIIIIRSIYEMAFDITSQEPQLS